MHINFKNLLTSNLFTCEWNLCLNDVCIFIGSTALVCASSQEFLHTPHVMDYWSHSGGLMISPPTMCLRLRNLPTHIHRMRTHSGRGLLRQSLHWCSQRTSCMGLLASRLIHAFAFCLQNTSLRAILLSSAQCSSPRPGTQAASFYLLRPLSSRTN